MVPTASDQPVPTACRELPCPGCSRTLRVPRGWDGTVRCVYCDHALDVRQVLAAQRAVSRGQAHAVADPARPARYPWITLVVLVGLAVLGIALARWLS